MLYKLFTFFNPVIQADERPERKNILVIGPRLPEYDRSSGDLRLYELLRILKSEYNIFFFNDAVWERFLRRGKKKYLKALTGLGVSVVLARKALAEILKTREIAAVICEFHDLGMNYLAMTKAHSPETSFIIDSVDVHFLRENSMAATLGSDSMKKQAAKNKAAELTAYSRADQVWVVSDIDRDALIAEGIAKKKIRIVPNILDQRTFSQDPPPRDTRNKDSLLFIGGFLHQPNVDAMEYFHERVLPLIRQAVPGVKLSIVGDSPPASVKRLAGKNVDVLGYVPDTRPYLNASMVSIAPLRFGAGLKGKVCEALAAGIPLVTTTTGSQGMNLESGRDCFIADDPAAFAGSVVRLLQEPGLWQALSANSRLFMKNNFGYEQIREDVHHLLKSLRAEDSAAPAKSGERC